MVHQFDDVYFQQAYLDRGSYSGYHCYNPYLEYRWPSPLDHVGSPRTPSAVKYMHIQPRSSDADSRDQRMLFPITKKRKGNNKYGQSGSQRCQRCQKGKRKCIYESKSDPCQRCVERGFDCGDKLPTPRKQAAQRQLQESGYCKDSDESSSSSAFSPVIFERQTPEELPLLPGLPTSGLRPLKGTKPEDEALCKLWENLNI